MGSSNKSLNKGKILEHINNLAPRVKKIRSENNQEESLKPVFTELLNRCGEHTSNLRVISEQKLMNNKKPDATIKNNFKVHGHWEAKSPDKNLKLEKKILIKKGYPFDNLILENSVSCILFQNNKEKIKIENNMWEGNKKAFSELLALFFSYETEDEKKFKKHKQYLFKKDILKNLILDIHKDVKKLQDNQKYLKKINKLVLECQKFINRNFKKEDAELWLIQHIMTEQIFLKVFDEQQYQEQNKISREIRSIEQEFLGHKKQKMVEKINQYIKPLAEYGANLDNENKQGFLKDFYQVFYQSFDKILAEELGIIYTPTEIVKFMIQGTGALLKKHFNKSISEKNVHILDPATGTGTYITELLHFINQENKDILKYKYENEIHANEYMVLPYYVASLNIEYVFQSLIKPRKSFKNLVLMDTLENSKPLSPEQPFFEIFDDSHFEENQRKVKSQNEKNIKIVIGNPPWKQQGKGKNKGVERKTPAKLYPKIKERIDNTYKFSKKGSSNKIKVLDDKSVYFLRWATDRIKDSGVVSFIVPRSIIDGKSGVGIRMALEKEFNFIYVIDLGGDIGGKFGGSDKPNSNVFKA